MDKSIFGETKFPRHCLSVVSHKLTTELTASTHWSEGSRLPTRVKQKGQGRGREEWCPMKCPRYRSPVFLGLEARCVPDLVVKTKTIFPLMNRSQVWQSLY
jgi:hypothetical protein